MAILSQFQLEGTMVDAQPFGNGHINDTLKVINDKGEAPYVLQRINHQIFTNVDMLQENIRIVTEHIRRQLVERGEQDIDRKVLTFLPGTYGTSLLRNHAMRGVFEEMRGQGFPDEVVEAIRDSVDCNLYFFGDKVGLAAMYAVLAGAILIAVGLYIWMNVLKGRKK